MSSEAIPTVTPDVATVKAKYVGRPKYKYKTAFKTGKSRDFFSTQVVSEPWIYVEFNYHKYFLDLAIGTGLRVVNCYISDFKLQVSSTLTIDGKPMPGRLIQQECSFTCTPMVAPNSTINFKNSYIRIDYRWWEGTTKGKTKVDDNGTFCFYGADGFAGYTPEEDELGVLGRSIIWNRS
ncbi:MAG: hypothetical protein H0T78_04085 [Longispora sp.]|nr:hypothetical protein [Longispora sp. (in: high G+C Gram-positive bacteria)]